MHGMAYYIFLKSLRSLEEFWKNPHVKTPPKYPCANFQSLGKFKIQFLIQKFFFSLLSARPTLRPTRPLAQPARWPRCPHRPKLPRSAHLAHASVTSSWEYVFPFGSRLPSWLPLPRLSVQRAPLVSFVARSTPQMPSRLYHPPHHPPLNPLQTKP
jgi:hypothetical protein